MRTYERKNLGATIAKRREQANMTQKELAEKVGVSNAFLSLLERGEKFPSIETLCALATALDVSCDALLYDEAPDASLTTINQLLAGKSLQFLRGIEDMIRVCDRHFSSADEDPTQPAVREDDTSEAGREQM